MPLAGATLAEPGHAAVAGLMGDRGTGIWPGMSGCAGVTAAVREAAKAVLEGSSGTSSVRAAKADGAKGDAPQC